MVPCQGISFSLHGMCMSSKTVGALLRTSRARRRAAVRVFLLEAGRPVRGSGNASLQADASASLTAKRCVSLLVNRTETQRRRRPAHLPAGVFGAKPQGEVQCNNETTLFPPCRHRRRLSLNVSHWHGVVSWVCAARHLPIFTTWDNQRQWATGAGPPTPPWRTGGLGRGDRANYRKNKDLHPAE
jgi:hypothetical protein